MKSLLILCLILLSMFFFYGIATLAEGGLESYGKGMAIIAFSLIMIGYISALVVKSVK